MELIVALFLSLFTVKASSQIATLYDVIHPSPFNGSSLTTTDPNCLDLEFCPVNSKLTDGDFGPMDSLNGQLGKFFAFNQNDSRLTFLVSPAVSTVVLYFFNSPADSIGLPQLKVLQSLNSPPVPYFFSNNDKLTLTDSQLRTVTLHLNQNVTTVQINFIFPVNSRINWFLVSEVQFFAGDPVSAPMEDIVFKDGSMSVVTLGPDNIQSSISINCTVLNNGSFQWNWLFNNTIPITDELFIEDATRTSILNITGLSYSNEGNYTCTANNTAGSMSSRIIQIRISSSTSNTSTISSSSVSIATSTANQQATVTTTSVAIIHSSSTATQTPAVANNGGLDTVVVGLSVSLGVVAFIIVGLILLTIVLVKCRKRCANRSLQVPMFKISYNIAASNKSSFTSQGNDERDVIAENDIPLFQRNTVTDVLYDVPDIPEETNPPAEDDEDVIYAKPKVNKVTRIKNESFEEIALLGTGQFGEVVLAKTIGLSLKELRLDKTDDDKFATVQVAVKKIKENQSKESISALKKEIKFMSHLDHDNVVRLLAVSAESCQEQFIVMEYMENGDLNKFLMDHSFTDSHPPEENELSPNILLSFCIQIANGMSYLSSRNFIHRDLASRNILVGPDYIVKVGDFGLSRNLYDSSYYKVSGKAKMPIRWMAKECFYGKFSEITDLWAFGVTVWEIYMMSRDYPYSFMTDQEVIDNALKGFNCDLLEKPETCPERVFSVIVKLCWSKERKTFAQVHKELVHADQRLYQYCDVLHWN